jgi:hypothetical protein
LELGKSSNKLKMQTSKLSRINIKWGQEAYHFHKDLQWLQQPFEVFEDPQHCLLSLIANECLLETLLALGWFLIEYMKNMNKVETKFK